MKIIDQAKYDEWKAVQDGDDYGLAIFRYAEAWADLMEARLAKGEALEDIAEATSHEADTEGMTGFMYGVAVVILATCWEHGEQLRRWHNLTTQIGDEGVRANERGTVLNPAMLGVSGNDANHD